MAQKEVLIKINVDDQSLDQLTNQVKDLGGEIKKVEQTTNGLSLDQKFKAAQGGIKAFAGAVEAAVGAVGLLGIKSKVFDEYERYALAAISFGRGIFDLSEGIKDLKDSTLLANVAIKANTALNVAATAVTKALGIATNTTSTSFKVLKGAIAATGIGLLIVGIGELVSWMNRLSDATDVAATGIDRLNSQILGRKDAFDDSIKAMEANNLIAINNLKQQGASEEELFNERQAQLLKLNETYKKESETLGVELKKAQENFAIAQKNGDQELIEDREKQVEALTALIKQYDDKALELTRKFYIDYSAQGVEAYEKEKELLRKQQEERTKFLIDSWELREDIDGLFEEAGMDAASIFNQAFIDFMTPEETIQDKLRKIKYIDPDPDQVDESLFGPEGVITKFQQGLQDALDKTIRNKEQWDSFVSTASKAFDTIEFLSAQRYERELLNIERQRSAIESNVYLTEEERTASLNRIEAQERAIEERRIKAERDQFTLKQSLLLAETVLQAKFYAQQQINEANLNVAKATGTAQEIALAGTAAAAKAQMSIGAFVAALGPLGVVAFAASIGGIIASIISARRTANAQIAALGGRGVSSSSPSISTPTAVQPPAEAPVPQTFNVEPVTRTYVLTGDITSGVEAQAKLNTKRTII